MNQIRVTNSNIVTDNTNRENFLQKATTGKPPIRQIGWHEWDDATSALAHKLISKHVNPDFIYSIPRGGLLLGVQMSHALKAPLVVEHPRTWNMEDHWHKMVDGHRPPEVLIVDSIVDTGKTLCELKAKDWLHEYNVHYAAVYCDPKQRSVVDTYQVGKHTNQWLEFPWETIATIMLRHPYRMHSNQPKIKQKRELADPDPFSSEE